MFLSESLVMVNKTPLYIIYMFYNKYNTWVEVDNVKVKQIKQIGRQLASIIKIHNQKVLLSVAQCVALK